ERLAALRLDQSILVQGSRWIDVLHGRHNVVIAGQNDGYTGRHQIAGVCEQTVEPGQFVVELRTWLWIAIREIEGSDQDAIHSRLDVASLVVLRITGQAGPSQHRILVSREDR